MASGTKLWDNLHVASKLQEGKYWAEVERTGKVEVEEQRKPRWVQEVVDQGDINYIARHTLELASQWELDTEPGLISFRDNRVSTGQSYNVTSKKWEIIYAYGSVRRASKYGFGEYRTLTRLLRERNLLRQFSKDRSIGGLLGLELLAAHEMAHVVTYRLHGWDKYWTGKQWRRKVAPHGDEYVEVYVQMLDEVVSRWGHQLESGRVDKPQVGSRPRMEPLVEYPRAAERGSGKGSGRGSDK